MNLYNTMMSWAKHVEENQTELDALNKDYWKQDQDERIRRDVKKQGAISGRSFASGALSVLIDLHLEVSEDNGFISDDDRLVESDIIKARSNSDYAAHIEGGGALSFAAWQRIKAERDELYAMPENEMSDTEWRMLHNLDLKLGY